MFIAICQPVLSPTNRTQLLSVDPLCFSTTHKMNLNLVDFTSNCINFGLDLKREQHDDHHSVQSLYQILCPESVEIVAKRHKESIN
jgi:hypothetical protein